MHTDRTETEHPVRGQLASAIPSTVDLTVERSSWLASPAMTLRSLRPKVKHNSRWYYLCSSVFICVCKSFAAPQKHFHYSERTSKKQYRPPAPDGGWKLPPCPADKATAPEDPSSGAAIPSILPIGRPTTRFYRTEVIALRFCAHASSVEPCAVGRSLP
jgi:hypothetical protein